MQYPAMEVHTIDWPNLLAGVVIAGIFGLIAHVIKQLYESWITSKDLPYSIDGTWFSAEFDPKGVAEWRERNTFTKVFVRRKLGGQFSMQVVQQLGASTPRPATAWGLTGKMLYGDTLVGKWQSSLENTKRFGAVVLKFVDYGRAVGYWIGQGGTDHPVYGYLIMSRQEDDARLLAQGALEVSHFKFWDVAQYVLDQPPSETSSRSPA